MIIDHLVALDAYPGPPRDDAESLLLEARSVDDGMSFSAPRGLCIPPVSTTVEIRTGLHRWTLRAADDTRPAGVLTLRQGRGPATVIDLVVRPDHRSTGVATAALEEAFATGAFDGAEVVVACAYGSHPAAIRLTRRFGATVVAERHHMTLATVSSHRQPHAGEERRSRRRTQWDVLAESSSGEIVDGVGSIDLLHTASTDLAGTVGRAVTELSLAGARSIEAVVDARDDAAIDVLRSAAFGHDRTDALTRLDLRNRP